MILRYEYLQSISSLVYTNYIELCRGGLTMTTEEYRNYKILFEKCFTLKPEEYDYDFYFGSAYEADIDLMLENENPKKEPENEV